MRQSEDGAAGHRRSKVCSGWRATDLSSTSPAAGFPVSRNRNYAPATRAYSRELDLPIDATDPVRLMLFPEMDARHDVPEITTACWGILRKSPEEVMCASARMVVKRKDAAAPTGTRVHIARL